MSSHTTPRDEEQHTNQQTDQTMSKSSNKNDEQEPERREEFNPPVDIINDPTGHQTKRHEQVKAIKWGFPRSCDAKLVMKSGGDWTVNRHFLSIADDDPLNRSLTHNGETEDTTPSGGV